MPEPNNSVGARIGQIIAVIALVGVGGGLIWKFGIPSAQVRLGFSKVTVYPNPGCGALFWAGDSFTVSYRRARTEKMIASEPENSSTNTPLMIAAVRGDIDLVKDLISRDVKIDEVSKKGGCTALMWALSFEEAEISAQLLAAGADPQLADDAGRTPLMVAAKSGLLSSVEALITAGADVNHAQTAGQNEIGRRALSLATSKEQNAPVLEYLLANGAEVDAVDEHGKTALMAAAFSGHAANVQALLNAGADPNHTSNSGGTALRNAKIFKHSVVIELLESRM